MIAKKHWIRRCADADSNTIKQSIPYTYENDKDSTHFNRYHYKHIFALISTEQRHTQFLSNCRVNTERFSENHSYAVSNTHMSVLENADW